MVIVPLAAAHDRTGFDCGVEEMNVFLRQYARQNAQKDLSRTFVALGDGETHIVGFYTLTGGMVDFETLPVERLPRYPIPVVLLARLAVDRNFQGKRIGEHLLFDALARAEDVSQQTGMFAVVVDALDENAAAFYRKYGFLPQPSNSLRLYITMKTIRKLALT